MTCDRIHACYGNIHKEPLADIHKRMYERFIGHKSFCLLETCPKQWLENNKRSRPQLRHRLPRHEIDPFNVFEGTQFMEGSRKSAGLAEQMHAARKAALEPWARRPAHQRQRSRERQRPPADGHPPAKA